MTGSTLEVLQPAAAEEVEEGKKKILVAEVEAEADRERTAVEVAVEGDFSPEG